MCTHVDACLVVAYRLAQVTAGHSNRVFSLKFNHKDENVVISGGWDNTIQVRRPAHTHMRIHGDKEALFVLVDASSVVMITVAAVYSCMCLPLL